MNKEELRRNLVEIKDEVDTFYKSYYNLLYKLQKNNLAKLIDSKEDLSFGLADVPKKEKTDSVSGWTDKNITTKYTVVLNETKSSKVGNVAVTYAPEKTCPNSCRFKNNGCYAQLGHCGFTMNRISRAAEKATLKAIALEEAAKISKLPGDKDLRLHISGDCRTPETAQILAAAAKEYKAKQGNSVWTYTHSWKLIPRKNWGDISVLASCETFDEVKYANSRGYAAALVRYKPFSKPFKYEGFNLIPCVEQIGGNKCNKCRLCTLDQPLLNSKSVVCFFAHGCKTNRVTEILKEL